MPPAISHLVFLSSANKLGLFFFPLLLIFLVTQDTHSHESSAYTLTCISNLTEITDTSFEASFLSLASALVWLILLAAEVALLVKSVILQESPRIRSICNAKGFFFFFLHYKNLELLKLFFACRSTRLKTQDLTTLPSEHKNS